jgi:N-acetylglucosaminyl-diphospho-decaprenol L-rhamnosyltransferase
MRIDYVIVAYRSAADLPECLSSIAADALSSSGIIVVDNASPDDSAVVAGSHPSAPSIVRSKRNLGFGGGCNLGAGSSSADALFFLNPDARLVKGATDTLIEALSVSPGTGLVAPRVVDPSGESRAASAGAEPGLRSTIGHYLLLGRLPLLGRIFRPLHLTRPDRPASPDWVSGAAMLVRRDAFSAVGGFDEQIFMYMEDVDLCRRLRSSGWRVDYRPDAIVEHRIGGSQSTDQPARWFNSYFDYLRRRHGSAEARTASLVAGLGLGIRAIAYRAARPANAARVGRAARAAFRVAFGRSGRLT